MLLVCAVLRAPPKNICRYVTLNAPRPRHLSRPLACVLAGELPCGCYEWNAGPLRRRSPNFSPPWRGVAPPFSFCHILCSSLSPPMCCHANVGLAVWSLPIWCTQAKHHCFLMGKKESFKRQADSRSEAEREGGRWMERGRETHILVFYSVSSGRKMKCNLYTGIGHCLHGDFSIQIMTLKRHWPEFAGSTRTQ